MRVAASHPPSAKASIGIVPSKECELGPNGPPPLYLCRVNRGSYLPLIGPDRKGEQIVQSERRATLEFVVCATYADGRRGGGKACDRVGGGAVWRNRIAKGALVPRVDPCLVLYVELDRQVVEITRQPLLVVGLRFRRQIGGVEVNEIDILV